MNTKQHSYVKIGEQRGKKRIWLEGLRLSACGFDKGQRYNIVYNLDTKSIILKADSNGSRIISGKKTSTGYLPILDICNADLVNVTQGAQRVRVDFSAGEIVITVHHHDTKQAIREQKFISDLEKNHLTEGTICAGIGMATAAIHEGLTEKGINSTVEWIIDRERKYLQVACDNNSAITEDTRIFEASIEEIEPELLTPVSICQCSLPCTGHSLSGKVKNKIKLAEQHVDAASVFGLIKIIEAVNPAVIVSENVIQAQESSTYLLVKAMLETLGYTIYETVLDEVQAGSFEKRKRYWFVAVSTGLDAIDLSAITVFKKEYSKLSELLEPVSDDDSSWSDNDYLKTKQIRDKQAGKGFANRSLVDGDSDHVKTIGRGYQKRRSTESMLTRPDGKERLLTPIEHARVKGAPESLIKNVVATTAHEGLGQGIIWNQGKGIGHLLAGIRLLHAKHVEVELGQISLL